MVECEVTQGAIPAELRGTLFRIGAGRVRVGETPYGHWFDGDGWACAVAFPGGGAPPRFRARYVETPRRTAQAAYARWWGAGQRWPAPHRTVETTVLHSTYSVYDTFRSI